MQPAELAHEQVAVWVVDASLSADHNEHLIRCLSGEDLVRLKRYTNKSASDMFLASRGALRALLGRLLHAEPSEIEIATHEHGKPFLPQHPELFFNISHSRTLALIAMARHPVGVDVEYLQRPVDFAAVMRRFFSAAERAEWSEFSVPTPQQAFFRGWTRKEAILKATGEGISGLGHTVISFKPDEPQALHERLGDASQSDQWRFCDFIPLPDYQASVALQAPTLQLTLQTFSL